MPFIKILLLTLLLSTSYTGVSQNVLFNTNGGTPDPSAILEMRSTEQGVLVPRMLEGQRLSILSPAEGLLVYQRNGLVGFYYYNGIGWDTIGGSTVVNNISNVTNVTSSGIAVIRDEKPINTNGGTFTSGTWQQRDLNTLTGDDSFVSLNLDSITLDSGIYVITISVPAFNVEDHQARLYRTTIPVGQVAVGSMGYAKANGGAGANTESRIVTVVEVGAAGETYVIQHRCSLTNNGDGFGRGAPWAGGESVFTQVQIEKL